MDCIQCKRPFLDEDRIASISGSIMGDESTDTYYFCGDCGVYTVEVYHEAFLVKMKPPREDICRRKKETKRSD